MYWNFYKTDKEVRMDDFFWLTKSEQERLVQSIVNNEPDYRLKASKKTRRSDPPTEQMKLSRKAQFS